MVKNPPVVMCLAADGTGVGVVESHSLLHRFELWHGIAPFLNRGVAVGVGVAAGGVVVVGWEVPPDFCVIRVQDEAAVVDAVRVFVSEDPQVGRRRIDDVREDVVLAPSASVNARDGRTHRGIVKAAFDVAVHRHAPHAR